MMMRLKAFLAALCLLLGLAAPVAAQGTNVPWIPLYFVNATGVLCNGCLLDTWAAGTTTAQSTFSDSALSTANANPVVMGSDGRPTSGGIYLSATSYRFRLRTAAGVTIWTINNITSIPTTSGDLDVTGTAGEAISAGNVVYLSDGSGSLTAGRWYIADADNTYGSTTAVLVGIAPSAIASAASGTIRVAGRVTGLSGLTAGEIYYASATAGALTGTPPTNARCIGKADSTTTLVSPCDSPVVRIPDSDGTHSLVTRTSSDLTADRLLTLVTGDAAHTLTLNRPRAPGGRCTLTTGVAVTTADVTAATTLFYTMDPRAQNPTEIWFYNGSAWVAFAFTTQLSIAVPATTNTVYDVFIDYTSGVPALEAVAWTNDTTRATALATQNSVYVQTSDTDSLYVCSFRTTGVSGQTEDSVSKRYVWNYYNRATRTMFVTDATNSWAYTNAAFQQANASAANQLDVVVGVADVAMRVRVDHHVDGTTVGQFAAVSIGYDSTSAPATGASRDAQIIKVSGYMEQRTAVLNHYPAVGRHLYVWLESGGTNTTFYGDNGGAILLSGIFGDIEG